MQNRYRIVIGKLQYSTKGTSAEHGANGIVTLVVIVEHWMEIESQEDRTDFSQ